MYSHKLSTLADAVGGTVVGHSVDPVVTALCLSSSTVTPGALFIAIRGTAADGHTFINDAFERGAVACVVEDESALNGRPGIVVPQARRALSRLAALFAGEPSKEMKVVGVTGTNGKTTSNWIVYHTLHALGVGALRVGTLGWEYLGRDPQEGALTSPDPISLHRLMRDAYRAGARACVMETSSHALHQARVEDVQFDVGVFTNLTRDHLDYHGTFENYFAAKRYLFELLSRSSKSTKGAVVNADDPYGKRIIAELATLALHDWSFGTSGAAAVVIERVEETADEMLVHVTVSRRGETFAIAAPFIGLHNAENVVAAFATCCALGYEPRHVLDALRKVPQVPGRLERVGDGEVRVFVDYAHTPDALERALAAVRPSTTGALWVVFGCGGDRDRGKRPEMALAAARGADKVVVTSDNPRTEDPEQIIRDILSSEITPVLTESDRRRAISETIYRAAPGDTVLIAGKGHENYQILGTEKIHFSDQGVAWEALELREASAGT